jgi:hypothetical protein
MVHKYGSQGVLLVSPEIENSLGKDIKVDPIDMKVINKAETNNCIFREDSI